MKCPSRVEAVATATIAVSLACGGGPEAAAPTPAVSPAPAAAPVAATPPAVAPDALWSGVDLLTSPPTDGVPMSGARILESDADHVRILTDPSEGHRHVHRADRTFVQLLGTLGFEQRYYPVDPPRSIYANQTVVARGADVLLIDSWTEGSSTLVELRKKTRPPPASAPVDTLAPAVVIDDLTALGEKGTSCALGELWTWHPDGTFSAEGLEYANKGTWAREGGDLVVTMARDPEFLEPGDDPTRKERLVDAAFYRAGDHTWLTARGVNTYCAPGLDPMSGESVPPQLRFVLDAGGGPARTDAIARMLAARPDTRVAIGSSPTPKRGVTVTWARSAYYEADQEPVYEPDAFGAIDLATWIEPYDVRVQMEPWKDAPHPLMVLVGAE